MSTGFVWFHNGTDNQKDSINFYEKLLGWKSADGPPGLTMFAGEKGPFAAVGSPEGGTTGWIPYAQVDDVTVATKSAQTLGATVLQPKTKGPAGDYSIIRDPGGATLALWKKAA